MAGYFPAVPHTAIRNDFCRLYLIIEYRPVLMMYGFEYALLQYCPVNLRGLGQKANSGGAFRVT